MLVGMEVHPSCAAEVASSLSCRNALGEGCVLVMAEQSKGADWLARWLAVWLHTHHNLSLTCQTAQHKGRYKDRSEAEPNTLYP